MSRTNKCKVCGWTGQNPPTQHERFVQYRRDHPLESDRTKEPFQTDSELGIVRREWVGTNHNLCSDCVPARQAQIEADPSDYRNGWRRTMRTSPLAALASAFLPGARP